MSSDFGLQEEAEGNWVSVILFHFSIAFLTEGGRPETQI